MGQDESKPAKVITYHIHVPEALYLSDKVDACLKEFAKDVTEYREAKAFRSAFRMSAERSQEVAKAMLPFANPEQLANFQEWQQAFCRAIGQGILISGGNRTEQFDIIIKSVATGLEAQVSTKSSGVRDDILKLFSDVVPTITETETPQEKTAKTDQKDPAQPSNPEETEADRKETAEPLKKRRRVTPNLSSQDKEATKDS